MLARVDWLPVGYLSPSSIEMFLRCPRQYYFRYVQGLKIPPAVAMVEGTSHHAAVSTNNSAKVAKGVDMRAPDVIEAFIDAFNQRKGDIEDWEDETPKAVIDRGRGLLARYMTTFAPGFKPKSVELQVEETIAGVPVIGFIDSTGSLRKDPKVIVDYKVSKRAKSVEDVGSSIQLTFYGHAAATNLKMHNPRVGFCTFKKTKEPDIDWQSVRYVDGMGLWLKEIVGSVSDSIRRGSFPVCDPSGWQCSERFCGYWARCRGRVLGAG